MSAQQRARAGKYNKVKRGGGKHFSKDLQPINADGEVIGMWGARDGTTTKNDNSSSEEESSEEESSNEEDSADEDKPSTGTELTREQRKAAAKARREAAIAKQNGKATAVGDMPSSEEDSEDEDADPSMPANPNHTAKARALASKPKTAEEEEEKASAAAAQQQAKKKIPTEQLSRREREALEAARRKKAYDELHRQGKTDEAQADLARLKLIREKREQDAARKKAEAEEKAEADKAKADQMAREQRMREAAAGKRGGRGGKKK